jgi:hypothetical protein
MRKTILILAGVFCWVGACANNESNVAPAQESQKQAAEEITKDTAAKLAGIHLALKNWTWGKPQDVVERDGKFYVYYSTPEKELRVLGPRVLVVDKASNVVTVQKRR